MLTDRAGRTYVLTRDPAVVRFDRDGRQDLVLGRQGGGPGEFQFPVSIGAKGDTVWVLDVAKRALVKFTPNLDPAPDQRLDGALERADLLAFRTGGAKQALVRAWRSCGYLYQIVRAVSRKV